MPFIWLPLPDYVHRIVRPLQQALQKCDEPGRCRFSSADHEPHASPAADGGKQVQFRPAAFRRGLYHLPDTLPRLQAVTYPPRLHEKNVTVLTFRLLFDGGVIL